ncbi:tryptophan synthase subunit beta like protein [Azoarcus sp. TTM-91]|nr:tryptophan synthase subunit beta like protein [Azoarcus sp. TTM-91]NMG36859.1 tryptophan synthase subunit beta like protein [Azoarcus sp. TTM-91]NMG67742.1 tryptophan synthase subunit beta like protein [Azoarcus indigens]
MGVYVKRDGEGRILAISRQAEAGFDESLPADSPEIAGFIGGNGREALASTDLRLVRVLEDVIDLLIARDLIRFTDLPQEAQDKLLQRRTLRAKLGGLDLLDSDDGLI